jgi:aminopeptidase N
MSALSKENLVTSDEVGAAAADAEDFVETDADAGDRLFEFTQPVPIPSYLFALAVGELKSIDVSPRCRVWSEPSMVEAVAYEFSQVEDFLVAAEEVTMVPYQWGRYDLLCLPPSFPYGGMENPCLTFVTPTLLAGDKRTAGPVSCILLVFLLRRRRAIVIPTQKVSVFVTSYRHRRHALASAKETW